MLLIHQSKREKTRLSSVSLILRVNPLCCMALHQCYPVEDHAHSDHIFSRCFITVGRAVADRHAAGKHVCTIGVSKGMGDQLSCLCQYCFLK